MSETLFVMALIGWAAEWWAHRRTKRLLRRAFDTVHRAVDEAIKAHDIAFRAISAAAERIR